MLSEAPPVRVSEPWYSLYLQYAPLRREPIRIAVMAFNESRTKLAWLFRDHWQDLLDGNDEEVLGTVDDYFTQLLGEMGTTAFIKWLETSLSNALRAENGRRVKNASVLEGGSEEEIREFLAGILESVNK